MGYDEISYNDESVESLEKYLLYYYIILRPLDARNRGQKSSIDQPDMKSESARTRSVVWTFLQISMGAALLRYLLLATAHEENVVSLYLGDTFRNFGTTPRTVFYASIVGQSLFAVGFNLITRYFEKREMLDYMIDLKTLRGLSPENYRRLKFLSSLYAFAVPKSIVMIQLLYVFLYSFGIYQG